MLNLDGRHSGPLGVHVQEVGGVNSGPGRMVGQAHVAGASTGHGQAQGVGRLLQGRGGVGDLDQPQVEVVGAQAGQGGVQGVQEGAA